MLSCTNKKNKIVLSDYNYKRDIANRLLMAHFTVFELEVLEEILHSSLQIVTRTLAEHLETSVEKLLPALDKLSQTNLLTHQDGVIIVDKEMRKYYESQIVKFDEDFQPGIDYLQGILNKVPIHALPNWYAISRSSDNIFSSILEKYLETPKTYERYLGELSFDNPVLNHIIKDVFTSPDFQVLSDDLRKKYDLSSKQFEEYMLHLEYNFVCCLGYILVNDVWEEVVTPFHEWREFLRFQRDTEPKPIKKSADVKRFHASDYGFIEDLNTLLASVVKSPLKTDKKTLGQLLPHLEFDQVEKIIHVLTELCLVSLKGDKLQPEEYAKDWLKKSLQDQAILIYRLPMSKYRYAFGDEFLVSDKDIRETEKSVKRVIGKGWIYFDDFFEGFLANIGNSEQIALKNKGKRWRYATPTYSDQERLLVEKTIFERLYQTGMIAPGTHEGKLCFCVTPFGSMALGD